MKIYLTTDTHFGHKKLIEYGRPDNFEELIFKNLKNLPEGCILIHLGDVGLGRDGEMHSKYIEPIKCKKILVRGNHDHKSDNWYLEHGWDFVCRRFESKYFGKNIMFSHIPVKDNNFYDINIHGHFHDSDHHIHEAFILAVKNNKQKLLALEHTNYKPVLLEEFLKL